MSDILRFDWEWLACPELPPEEAATFGELRLWLNGKAATRLYDLEAQSERDGHFAAAYPLALFLAENWWRLRWEPAPASLSCASPRWRLAHSMAAAGGGYVWPNITFHGDGERMFAQVGPHRSTSSSVRFVEQGLGAALEAETFEAEIDRFLRGVLARLEARGLPETELRSVWRAVLAERADSMDFERRRLEAMAGFDPDEAPQEMLDELLRLEQRYGEAAVQEVTAGSRGETLAHVRVLEQALHDRGLRYTVPDMGAVDEDAIAALSAGPASRAPPWRRAIEAARAARRAWGLGDGPLDNKTLAALTDMPADQLGSTARENAPYSASLDETGQHGRLVFRTGHRHGRRFALGRLIGDAFYSPGELRRLAVVTDTRTGRQKFQRAFAQELLCPFQALADVLGLPDAPARLEDRDSPNADRIEEAAEHFDVSPVLVRGVLVNNGVQPIDALEVNDAA